MLKNKALCPLAIVKNSYHEYVLNYCNKYPYLLSCPQAPLHSGNTKDKTLLSLYLSGYIDRLQYVDSLPMDSYISCIHNVIRIIDMYILGLKSLILEISTHQLISKLDNERLVAFDKLCAINKELKQYVELQEDNSNKEDYSKLVSLGSNFLLKLSEIKPILHSAGLEDESYTNSIKFFVDFLNETADNFKNEISHNFHGVFINKTYSTFTSICIGIDFLRYIGELLNWEVIQNQTDTINSIFSCSVEVLYSLGENFTFRDLDIDEEYFDPDEEAYCPSQTDIIF